MFTRPTLSNIRKSSMVTMGESDLVMFKEKKIELGHVGLGRSESVKEKYETAFSAETTAKQKRVNENYQQ